MSPPAAPARRLFIALWPDAAQRAALAARRDAWEWPPGAALVHADKLHVTLHFLGQVPAERVEAVRGGIALPMTPFELTLREPRVWHGGIAVLEADAPPALLDLHVRLGLALDALGLPVEQRPYRPHVTLARKARGAVAPGAAPVAWPVRDYALVVSAGGEYAVMQRYRAAA
jgi:RNA 2',3'-cyclic 3'-phosphodiesterase